MAAAWQRHSSNKAATSLQCGSGMAAALQRPTTRPTARRRPRHRGAVLWRRVSALARPGGAHAMRGERAARAGRGMSACGAHVCGCARSCGAHGDAWVAPHPCACHQQPCKTAGPGSACFTLDPGIWVRRGNASLLRRCSSDSEPRGGRGCGHMSGAEREHCPLAQVTRMHDQIQHWKLKITQNKQERPRRGPMSSIFSEALDSDCSVPRSIGAAPPNLGRFQATSCSVRGAGRASSSSCRSRAGRSQAIVSAAPECALESLCCLWPTGPRVYRRSHRALPTTAQRLAA